MQLHCENVNNMVGFIHVDGLLMNDEMITLKQDHSIKNVVVEVYLTKKTKYPT